MTTGPGSVSTELLEAVAWLSEKGGIVLLQQAEVHVYRGSIHRCVSRTSESNSGVLALVEALRQVRAEYDRRA